MIHVIKEIESFNATEYIDQLLGLLKISEVCLLNFGSVSVLNFQICYWFGE